jgi:hypothetical protein
MPRTSERQQLIDYLTRAWRTALLYEMQAADDEDDEDEDEDIMGPRLSERLRIALEDVISHRYLNRRRDLPKPEGTMDLLLNRWKTDFPEIFRSYLRVTPECFDDLFEALRNDPVFQNQSQNEQMPVNEQLAIALYRFGHFGNSASITKTAHFFGVGFGTVVNVTKRVMAATCRERFRRTVMRWPDADAKEAAKTWVEEVSCPAWRDGWLMVDGTLVPLFGRPSFYGNTWFDRKHNYSMNVQVSYDVVDEDRKLTSIL